mmetsp:Transcript_3403/g.5177  ORF Transcript_3403/g.5177 Transcript_3403/m.5177 type:complete len:182 (+) Transcript_3403:92-637(+)|eukprot:CAMPEP_0194210684 /NCGR_PEP_ID=MMETSP0156-20130528/8956_1 /TAXON_ID=33649 /ORGANISM="Thalassionema nitzschioides, Strain L26-B" /LENGTH=181 /DNA_ID=CAMNT_0038938059 /DNA_START=19 /DNA_END=564 /DNA_ORIENTATION=+
MLSRISLSSRAVSRAAVGRGMVTVQQAAATADDALHLSGYKSIDYTINEEATVFDAIKKFSDHNIGCLVTVNEAGNLTGMISERDYISKIALLGRQPKETIIREISTKSNDLITATLDEPVEDCMAKMLTRGVRHLPLVGTEGDVVGLVSIKDLVKIVVQDREEKIEHLANQALGAAKYSV